MRKAFKLGLILIGLNAVLCQCSVETLPPHRWVSEISKHTDVLVKEYNTETIKYSAIFKPIEYIYFQDCIKFNSCQQSLDEFKNHQRNNKYFNFKIQSISSNQNLTPEFEHLMNYTSQQNFFLAFGSDTIVCDLYHHESSAFTNSHVISLGFTCEAEMNDDFTLLFYDNLLGTGKIEFDFDQDEIDKIPHLKNNTES